MSQGKIILVNLCLQDVVVFFIVEEKRLDQILELRFFATHITRAVL